MKGKRKKDDAKQARESNAFLLEQNLSLKDNIFTRPDENSTRQGFGETLVDLGSINENVVVLTADLTESTRTDLFKKAFPERFFDIGIAEQNMTSIAAGLALSGKIPFTTTFGVFATGRAWDQLNTSVAYARANVKIVATHTGITVGPDGATHQSLSDIALTRTIPNLTVIVPCDYEEAKRAVFAVAEHHGPVYLRLGRPKMPIVTTSDTPFAIGKAVAYCKGKDVTLIACGELVYESLIAAKKLRAKKISAGVINMSTIKPLDKEAVIKAAHDTRLIVSAEDHHLIGGLGSAVAEVLASLPNKKARQIMIGVGDIFGKSGNEKELMKEFHLTSDDIVLAVEKAIKH